MQQAEDPRRDGTQIYGHLRDGLLRAYHVALVYGIDDHAKIGSFHPENWDWGWLDGAEREGERPLVIGSNYFDFSLAFYMNSAL